MSDRTVDRPDESDSGHALEWHLVLLKSFEDITFDVVPWLHHAIVFLLSAFSHARFKAIGAVGNGMGCDGIQQLFIDAPAKCSVTFTLQCDQWLKCLK